MAAIGKVLVAIEYCVPCGYQNLAAWAVSEMFAAGGTDAAIQLTPGDGGIFKITVDGEVWYDNKDFDGRTPEIHDMKDLKSKLRNRLESLTAAAAR